MHSGVQRDNESTCSAGNGVWSRGDYRAERSWREVREAARLQEVEDTLRYICGLPEWRVPSDTSGVCLSGKAEKLLTLLRDYAIHNWPQPQERQWFESIERMWS